MNIHYELIGQSPRLDAYRDTLPALIAEYEANRPDQSASGKLMGMTPVAREQYVDEQLKRPETLEQLARGATIELCAEHFYGLSFMDFGSMGELIDAIRSMDQELEFK